MRKVIEEQLKIGEVPVSEIEFNPKSRDSIPKLLRGLKHIYCTPALKKEVFKVLETIIPEDIDRNNGRPGMELWKILVLGTIKINCNWGYDRLQEMADNHKILRQLLGHGAFNTDDTYHLQTLKDNVSLLTPEILDKINQVVIKEGHKQVKRKDVAIKGRCDSFVVKTNVHYPTDISLLFDAIRKVITLIAREAKANNLTGWRSNKSNTKKIKKFLYKVKNLKRSNAKDPQKKLLQQEKIRFAHQEYINLVNMFQMKAFNTLITLRKREGVNQDKLKEIEKYMFYVLKHVDLIERRVIKGEKIPHKDKVFSIFEKYTEWICKGKAGISQELGLRVAILEDQFNFILHHEVMQNLTDEKITVSIVEKAKEKFPKLCSCSFDKGFYTLINKYELKKLLNKVVLPKKGKLSSKEKEEEHSEEFIKIRYQHSAVESAINALNHHGLDVCPDHGIIGFKRYVAIAVLARNIQNLGNIIQKKEIKRLKRRERLKKRKSELYLAA